MKKILAAAVGSVAALAASSSALASGFNLREQSISGLGNAFAGATAGAEDISYAYFNPAGLTRHKGRNVNIGAAMIAPDARAKHVHATRMNGSSPYNGSDTGNIAKTAVVPDFYYSQQLDGKWTAAVSFNVPHGMTTKQDADWAGRFHGTYSSVETYTLTPMVACKATDKFSLGAGAQLQYVKAELRNSAGYNGVVETSAKLEGDDFAAGYTLGALYEFTPATRVGVGYRSAIQHKLRGDIEFGTQAYGAPLVDQDISAKLKTPANLSAGIYHDIDDKWSVMGEIGRTYWSSFKELHIVGDNGVDNTTEEKWSDTTFWALGASYQATDKLKLRAGFAMDHQAVKNDYRTPRIPETNRTWYSLGAEYKLDDNWTLNAGYTYIQGEKNKVELSGVPGQAHAGDAQRGGIYGDYSSHIHILGLGFNYAF